MTEGNIGISWTDEAMNSLVGCKECSLGCDKCYARMRIYRFSKCSVTNSDYRYSDLVKMVPKLSVQSDDEAEKEHLRFTGKILLTKRAHRLAELNAAVIKEFGEWPQNVWMGVSVCTRAKVELNKIAALGKTQARIEWVSFEPWVSDPKMALEEACPNLAGLLSESGIAWSVIGGESGSKKKSRLMTLEDARYLFSSSKDAGCSLHFKQLGTKLAMNLGVYALGDHRAKGGNLEQIPVDLRKRDWPENLISDAPKYSLAFKPRFDPKKWITFG